MSEQNENKIIFWLKKHKRLIIGIITIILIVFMAFIVDFPSLISKIITIGLWGTILFIISYTVAFILRAYKLKLIFKYLNLDVKYSTCYFSIGTAFVINDLTPGKIGDIAKILFIKDQEDINLSDSICGIAVERILDLLLLFSISAFALIYLYLSNINDVDEKILLGQSIQFYLAIGAILLIGILVLIILIIYKTDFIVRIVSKVSNKLSIYIKRFLRNFKSGMRNFKDNKKGLLYINLLGFPTWIIDAALAIIFFRLLGYQFNIFLIIIATILTFFSKTFPITPGGWVISENIGALFIFILYSSELIYPDGFYEILSIFLIDHSFRSAYLYFFGGYSIFHYNFKLKELEKFKSSELNNLMNSNNI